LYSLFVKDVLIVIYVMNIEVFDKSSMACFVMLIIIIFHLTKFDMIALAISFRDVNYYYIMIKI